MLELGAGGPAPALPLSSSLWGHIRDPQAQCVNTWQESALGLGYTRTSLVRRPELPGSGDAEVSHGSCLDPPFPVPE